MTRANAFGQPIGPDLAGWRPPPRPEVDVLPGRWVRVERLDVSHADELYDALGGAANAALWTYSAEGPFTDRTAFATCVRQRAEDPAAVAVAIVDGHGTCGLASLLAIQEEHGTVEVGSIVLGPRLQRTTAATEAMYLMARHVFELGYRRYEWKCDALNEPSRRAALRLGFTHEGRFRNATTYKGRSRNTDWFSITDAEWTLLEASYRRWLDPENHTGGVQRASLADVRRDVADAVG